MSDQFPNNPYQTPQFPSQFSEAKQPLGPMQQPQVVIWARVYNIFMVLTYLFVFGMGIFSMLNPEFIAEHDPDTSREEALILGVVYMVMGGVLGLFFLVAAFSPRNKVGWIINIIGFALSTMSCCCLPACIPLIIYWVRDDCRRWFGMN